MTALVLTDKISQSSGKSVKYNTTVTAFGDGFEQRVSFGINPKREMWNIVYENLTQADRDAVWVMIDDVQQTGIIEWTATGDTTEKKWAIDPQSEIAEQSKAGDIFVITFTIKRVFDL